MPFLHPLYLLGLVSIVSPLLIHFLARRRARVIPFSSLRFLIPSSTRRTFFLRLKELLLLLMRILALLLLTLGIAQPVSKTLSPNIRSVLILDNSYSMQAKQGEPREKAGEKVKEYLKKGGSYFLLTGYGKNIYKKDIEKTLSSLPVLYAPLPLNQLLDKSVEFLGKFPRGKKRIIIISDMQKINFSGVKSSYPLPIVFEEVDGRGGENASIENAELSIRGTKVTFELTLHNYSPRTKEGKIQLRIGGKLLREENIQIPPESTIPLLFSANLAPGHYEGTIKLVTEDDLKEDNLWFLSFSTFSPVKILCLNGRPSPVKYTDSAYYLSLALNPAKDKNFYLQPVVADRIPANLSPYPVVFLLEWQKFTPREAEILADYVNKGGILWIVPGKNTSLPAYNSSLSSLLPADLISPREGTYYLKDTPDFPLLKELKERVTFRHIISAKAKKDAHILLYFSGGYPALIENRLGKGKVYLFTSSLSLSSTDFPLTPYYLPFIYTSLTRVLSPAHSLQPIFTHTRVTLPSSQKMFTIVDPRGKTIRAKGSFTPLIPGIYRLKGIKGETFAVNSNRAESDLQKISREKAKKEMGNSVIWRGEEKKEALQPEGWGNLLLLAGLFILGMESILSNSFLPSEKAKRQFFLRQGKK